MSVPNLTLSKFQNLKWTNYLTQPISTIFYPQEILSQGRVKPPRTSNIAESSAVPETWATKPRCLSSITDCTWASTPALSRDSL